jgi:hypothetical protein
MGLSSHLFKLWQRYEHHLGVAALVLGFLFDLWIAKRPDSIADNILLISYLFIAGATIVILNIRAPRHKLVENSVEQLILLLVLQFCFGGLASNLFVLYGRSGTLSTGALFIGILGALVLGNEFLRDRYELLRFNIAVFYVLLFTYCVIATPTFVTHSIGWWQFLLSGIVSLVVVSVFLFAIATIALRHEPQELIGVSVVVGGIFIVFNLLYFLNFIPPVPLSLKDIGIYHSILPRQDGGYVALYEPPGRFEFWRDTSSTFLLSQNQGAFCFSSVFAPTDLETPIYHRWEYFDPTVGAWETRSRISFPISGGRSEGYRGFSAKYSLIPGTWRCDVETSEGALIGRITFTVVAASSSPALSQVIL